MEVRNSDLEALLKEPREALDIEIKEWLDLGSNDHKAALAKEVIALANHGGGFVIVGLREESDGTFSRIEAPTGAAAVWSQDRIQGILAKYLDPSVQCRVQTVQGHPVIAVPGGHRVPVRAKAGSPDGSKLVAHRIYVRRPGPNSEEPKTAEEWDRLLERCLQNRKDELLGAFRAILAGEVPAAGPPGSVALRRLAEFRDAAAARWATLVERPAMTNTPKLPHGFFEAAFALEGSFDRQPLSELRATIRSAVRNHSGWPPFVTIPRPPYNPAAVGGTIECWIGPDVGGETGTPNHHDFWRVSPEGLLVMRRGYPEDGKFREVSPGTAINLSTPIWQLGEAILEAHYIANALNARGATLLCQGLWTGLEGRTLVDLDNRGSALREGRTCSQARFESTEQVQLSALPASLPEVVTAMLTPFFELFDFFILPKRRVERELQDLQSTVHHA